MQDWRFDELTRTLGKATSRRGVLKGIVGGLAAAMVGRAVMSDRAAAAASCGDIEQCQRQVEANFRACVLGARAYRDEVKFCFKQALNQAKQCRESGCSDGLLCCNEQCVDIQTDPGNCGACFHTCSDREVCASGNCTCVAGTIECSGPFNTACCLPNESCYGGGFGFASCEKQCDPCEVYDPSDPSQPCKPMECPVCQQCDPASRQCLTVTDGTACGSNEVCCGGQCQNGTDCGCTGQSNNTSCGDNQVCCNEQCVDTTCPSGKTYDFDSCSCQCSSSCQPGELQDPDTCACQDLCSGVTCGDCEQCDPTTGVCTSTCSADEICCRGACQSSSQSCCNSDAQTCIDGTTFQPTGQCCPDGEICINEALTLTPVCCPTDPVAGDVIGALPDGTCCYGNAAPLECSDASWVCCDTSQADAACTCCGICA